VRRAAMLENEDQLMPAPVERSHAGVIFDPNTHVLEFGIGAPPCGEQLTDVPPIKDKMERPIDTMPGKQRAGLGQKRGILRPFISPQAMAKSR
jgi:hypothetical protein